MPRHQTLSLPLLSVLALLLFACSGDDAGDDDASGGDGPTAAAATPMTTDVATGTAGSEATSSEASGSDSGAATSEDIDVCALVSQDEVSEVIGTPAGEATRENDPALSYFGCRYEEDGITEGVSLGVFAFPDEDEARDFFEFGSEQFEAVEGIGEGAYRSEIHEITVLHDRYEIDVALYFVSEDDDEEFEMARELAEMMIDRLP